LKLSSWAHPFSSLTYPMCSLTKIACSPLDPTWTHACRTNLLSLPSTFGLLLTSTFHFHCFLSWHHCHNNDMSTSYTRLSIFLHVQNNLSSHVHIFLCLFFVMCTNMFVPPNPPLILRTHRISGRLRCFN
jgi:hypothetical protein